MTQEQVAWIGLIGVIGAAVLSWWLAKVTTHRQQESVFERDIGRLEGKEGPMGGIMRALGRLEGEVADARTDIKEIRARQEKNRDDAEREHAILRKLLQDQIDAVRKDMIQIRTQFSRIRQRAKS